MEEYNKIDELFRSAIEPLEERPSDKVWASLDAGLNKRQAAPKKGKRRIFFILFALLVGSFATYQFYGKKNNWSNEARESTAQIKSVTSTNNSLNQSGTQVSNQTITPSLSKAVVRNN